MPLFSVYFDLAKYYGNCQAAFRGFFVFVFFSFTVKAIVAIVVSRSTRRSSGLSSLAMQYAVHLHCDVGAALYAWDLNVAPVFTSSNRWRTVLGPSGLWEIGKRPHAFLINGWYKTDN